MHTSLKKYFHFEEFTEGKCYVCLNVKWGFLTSEKRESLIFDSLNNYKRQYHNAFTQFYFVWLGTVQRRHINLEWSQLMLVHGYLQKSTAEIAKKMSE